MPRQVGGPSEPSYPFPSQVPSKDDRISQIAQRYVKVPQSDSTKKAHANLSLPGPIEKLAKQIYYYFFGDSAIKKLIANKDYTGLLNHIKEMHTYSSLNLSQKIYGKTLLEHILQSENGTLIGYIYNQISLEDKEARTIILEKVLDTRIPIPAEFLKTLDRQSFVQLINDHILKYKNNEKNFLVNIVLSTDRELLEFSDQSGKTLVEKIRELAVKDHTLAFLLEYKNLSH